MNFGFLRSIVVKYLNWIKMDPPECIRGMKKLDKSLFKQTISVPCIQIDSSQFNSKKRYLKPYYLRLVDIKPIVSSTDFMKVLLKPKFKTLEDLKESDRLGLEGLDVPKEFPTHRLEIGYDQWRADEVLKSVLPTETDGLSSYSKIGHVLHVNLHEHLVPYKEIIGRVLLDKISGAKTVVNKTDVIDNTYRNFQMEILCGENNLETCVKENHCSFELDFGKVYWNPRLSTEHERMANLVKKGDVLYDVFAGIGPFAVPCAKKGVAVLANDLNPESYKWLVRNTKLNKVNIECFNKDGRAFISEELKRDLISKRKSGFSGDVHVVMNLPALATTFLDSFYGILPEDLEEGPLPIRVHVYCFVFDCEPEKGAEELVKKALQGSQPNVLEVKLVRKVSASKDMMRVSFELPWSYLLGTDQPPAKKICTKGDITDEKSIVS